MIYNLVQIIENSAKEFPKKEAFRYLDDAVTFEDLNVKSSQLATYLFSKDLSLTKVANKMFRNEWKIDQ